MGNATGIDNNQVWSMGVFGLDQRKVFEILSNLLAFILVNFAAERVYGKSLHNML